MLVSRSKRFLFIHIQKTGGQSLENALKRAIPDARRFHQKHGHAAWAINDWTAECSEYFKFAFVRNPWDRLVSWYSMIMQQSKLPPWNDRLWKRNRLWQYVLDRSNSFDEFVLNCTEVIDDVDGRKSFWYNQLDYISDRSGEILVDFIGRFETLEQDAAVIFRKLGTGDLEFPHINKSSHRHYSHYYSEETKNIVAERYQRDIAFFGYKFESV